MELKRKSVAWDGPTTPVAKVDTHDVAELCDLEASLRLANAQVADLQEKLTKAAKTEREFLGAELHDDVQQILFALGLNMAASRRDPADRLPTSLVSGWMQSVQTAMEHLHELTVALRKPRIETQEWFGTMRSYVETLPLALNQKVLFETDAKAASVPPKVAMACFRIVQEALGNAIKHSGAENLVVRVRSSLDRLTVSIRDDGAGFDVKNARARADGAGNIGLSSMQERAKLAGGHFDIRSSIGHGTRIRASFPVAALASPT